MSASLPARRGINSWHWFIQTVIGIFCVLVVLAIIFPALFQFKGSRRSPNLSSIKQLGLGLIEFASDHKDHLPNTRDPDVMEHALTSYVKNSALWNLVPPESGQFHFNGRLAGRTLSSILNASKTVLVYQGQPAADGHRYVAFADGHARWVSDVEWKSLRKD